MSVSIEIAGRRHLSRATGTPGLAWGIGFLADRYADRVPILGRCIGVRPVIAGDMACSRGIIGGRLYLA